MKIWRHLVHCLPLKAAYSSVWVFWLFLLLRLQTQEAAGFTVMVYYEAVQEKSRAAHVVPTSRSSLSCFLLMIF